jgi:hypothetical protein
MFDLDGLFISCSWCRNAWNGATGFGKRALNNGVVRGVATTFIAGAVCAGTAGAGCVLIAGAVIGGGLAMANHHVNHRGRGGVMGYARAGVGGAVQGSLSAYGGHVRYAFAREAGFSSGRRVTMGTGSFLWRGRQYWRPMYGAARTSLNRQYRR